MSFKFSIPGKLPGLNELIQKDRSHWSKGAELKKNTDRECAQWIMVEKVPQFTGPMHVHFDWYSADHKRDPDNIRTGAKFILDALTRTRRISDDSQRIIKGLSDSFLIDAENPRIEITLTEI